MSISNIYQKNELTISVEVFPPKTDKGIASLYEILFQIENYQPDFISVTYGAGGSTRDTTLKVVKHISENLKTEVMPHFTCVSHNKEEINQIIRAYEELGIKNILALRGDPPMGQDKFVKTEGGFAYASELIAYLHQRNSFDIGCAGFPECHIESADKASDRKYLKAKLDQGAAFVITQFFFENRHFFEWRDGLEALGAEVPLIPGIWLPSNEQITRKFSNMNRVSIPQAIEDIYQKFTNEEDRLKACIAYTHQQVEELIEQGVKGIHIYSFNQLLPVQVLSDLFPKNNKGA